VCVYTHTRTHARTHARTELCLFLLKYLFMWFDVLMIVLINIEVLWDIMLCQLVNGTGAYTLENPVPIVIRD